MLRRTLLRTSAVFAGSVWLGSPQARVAVGPYGPLQGPDAEGLALPQGFTGRVLARSGRRVAGLTWHSAPGDGACFPDGDGWIYVSNSGLPLLGGASALRFGAAGDVRDAYRILSGTSLNRAGGASPWHTWLSCEQITRGRVFECDPDGSRSARPRLAMGRFRHEAAAFDPDRQVVYLTEDEPDGCFYRFRPLDWGDLTEGALEVLTTSGAWRAVPSPAALAMATRYQVEDAAHFDRGGGCHYLRGVCYFATKGDGRLWAYEAERGRLDTVSGVRAAHGELFVAGEGEIALIGQGGVVSPFLRLAGDDRRELIGPAFSPDGRRLYFTALRGGGGEAAGVDGHTFEVEGPFTHAADR
ncbi:alkaline phosphatase PhoX [Nonomuraea dietziae]|uniref:alkaline phosphatase PhoX n=1 Tax=Nonomuraea dietziae TaxID=65515 RepID=UPI003441369D